MILSKMPAPPQMTIYYRLAAAIESIPFNHGHRIFAFDRLRDDGVTFGKAYIAAPLAVIYQYLCNEAKHNRWYELISKDDPVRFHLDVEMDQLNADAPFWDATDYGYPCQQKGLVLWEADQAWALTKSECVLPWDEELCVEVTR
jgi:hypothetical protein